MNNDMIRAIKRLINQKIPIIGTIKHALYVFIRQRVSKARVRRLIQERKEIWLEVGAGDKKGEKGWITLDITRNCDIFWDVRKGLPFPNESISRIYSSHFLEHLSFKEGQKFLDDCLRVLVPEGSFSICVPNARLYIEAYSRSDSLDGKRFLGYKPAYNNTTNIDYVNYVSYMDGHHNYMFDEDNLIYILRSKGFKNVHLREFNPDLDLRERDCQSIYAEGEKEGSAKGLGGTEP